MTSLIFLDGRLCEEVEKVCFVSAVIYPAAWRMLMPPSRFSTIPLIIVSPFKTAAFRSCIAVPLKISRVCICPSAAATISHGASFFLTLLPTPSRTSTLTEQPTILTDSHETSGRADIASSATVCVSSCFFLIPR